jgi:hypothetical protein
MRTVAVKGSYVSGGVYIVTTVGLKPKYYFSIEYTCTLLGITHKFS